MKPTSNTLTPKLKLRLHYKQGLALRSPATEIVYGGAAGGGKSHLLRAAAISWCLQVPGIQGYLFRRTVNDLYKNHFTGPTSFYAMLRPYRDAGLVRIVKNEIRFWNGSRIWCQHCQHEANVEDYRGYEFHFLLIDEMTTFTEKMLRFLQSRMRVNEDLKAVIPAELTGQFPRMLAGTNPGGVGHHYVKQNYVDSGEFKMVRASRKDGGRIRQFIPALLTDNPSLDYDQYSASLEGLGDPVLVRGMLDGDWTAVQGAQFGGVWRHNRHVVDGFEIPIEWPVWRGGDDGFAAPAAVLWFTQDPNTKTYYVIDEIYGAGMLPDKLAEKAIRHDKNIPRILSNGEVEPHGRVLSGIMDSAAFGDTGQQQGIPRGKQMNVRGCNWTPCEKWAGSRVAGCQNLHRLLAPNPKAPVMKDGTHPPGLRVFAHCTELIRTLPALARDKRNPEDVDTDGDDHLYDALRYGLQWKASGFQKRKIHGV